MDIADDTAPARILDAAAELGPVRALVNNAAIYQRVMAAKVPILDMSLDEWNRVLSVNLTGVSTTFARPPECMIERARPDVAQSYLSVLTVTSRGFGPEVAAADSSRTRPVGSEVWLQTTLELQ